MFLKNVIIILFVLFFTSSVMGQNVAEEEFKPLPESYHSIGIALGYSQFSLSGNFNMNTYSSKFLYDDKNDIYEVEGNSNYKISLFYNYYLNTNKLFALCGNFSYLTRHAKLSSSPKYLVRDPISLNTAYLLTESIINTYFNAFSIDLSVYARLSVADDSYLFFGFGPSINLILDNHKSDYSSTIIGLEHADSTSYIKTDITYKNGSQRITFDNNQVPDLGKAVEGNDIQLGLHFAIGMEWFIKNDFAIRFESTAQGDFSNYFKNQASGVVSSFNISLGVMYSGLF
jgi:hypothetical protein